MNGRKLCTLLPALVSLFLLLTFSSHAGGREELLFQQGNEAYSRGDFELAIARYEELTATAGYSAPVLYNLANSYAQTGRVGRAVLCYERAQRLAPSDSDIGGNLSMVRKESGLFDEEPDRTERFFHLQSLDQWALLGLFTLCLFTLFQAACLLRSGPGRKTRMGISVFCVLLLLLSVAGTAFRHRQFNPAVVIAGDARLLISPFTSAASIGAIQEGRRVFPQKDHGLFTYVRDESNRRGWILSTAIEPVVGPPK